jgi:Tfp pilus assembly protein PilX
MIGFSLNKKGVALYIILTMLLVVVILANVILNLVLSHSRLTHHQVSRIQAYYAAQAGMVYALEMLRTGLWAESVNPYIMCNANPACNIDNTSLTCDVNEVSLPCSVRSVSIRISDITNCPNSLLPGVDSCVQTTVNYAYTS